MGIFVRIFKAIFFECGNFKTYSSFGLPIAEQGYYDSTSENTRDRIRTRVNEFRCVRKPCPDIECQKNPDNGMKQLIKIPDGFAIERQKVALALRDLIHSKMGLLEAPLAHQTDA